MRSKLGTCLSALIVIAVLALPGQAAAQQHADTPYPYILIDLGTFGGPQADICCFPNGALTNSGLVAGTADTTMPDPYYPNGDPGINNGDPYVQHTFLWHRGVLTDRGALGAQPANNSSMALSVNARGDEAGGSETGITDTLLGYQESNAVLWARGQMIDLGTLGGTESDAWALNDRDQVVGAAANTIRDPFSIMGWATQTRAFLWQNGVMRDLGTLGGPDAAAQFVNERGQVTGVSYTTAISNTATGVPTQDPFVWQDGYMQDLATLGGTLGFPNWINKRGEVVGQSNLAGDQAYHPFLWDGHRLRDLGTFGGNNGFASWINDGGDVVGRADMPGSQTHHAFLWKHGVMMDLGVLPSDNCDTAWGVNDADQVVGGAGICGGSTPPHAFLWEKGAIYDLQSLAAASDLHLTQAWDINDQSEIFAFGIFPNGQQHAALLIPSPLAEREGITSNAPAPGAAGPATAVVRSSPMTCLTGPLWRAGPAHGYRLPCTGF